MKITIVDNQNMRLYMGDVNQYLKIDDCPEAQIVQFFNPLSTNTMDVKIEDGLCPIPNQYLDGSFDGVIKFYIYAADKTIGEGAFEIRPRQLPSGYIEEPTVILTYAAIITEMKEYLGKTQDQADIAKGYADEAKVSAGNANKSATSAQTSEENIKASEINVAYMKESVEQSEKNAKTYAENAEESATNAETSETNAKLSEIYAAVSETNAKISETNAKASADKAKTSEEKAAESATKLSDLQEHVAFTTDSTDSRLYHLTFWDEQVASFEIPADKFLKSVSYDESTQKLIFTFVLADESESVVNVDISSLVDTYTAGQGLALSNNQFSLKLKEGESVLKVGADGLYTDLSTKSDVTHNHDERYYTEAEINSKIATLNTEIAKKQNISNLVTVFQATPDDTHYPSEKLVSDKLSEKSDVGHTHTKSEITDFDHTHDDRYYTEREIDTKFDTAETKLTDNVSILVDPNDAKKFHLYIYGTDVANFTIPYNNAVKSVTFNEVTKNLKFVFLQADGSEETELVDISTLVDTYTAGNGLSLTDGQFSFKIKEGENVLKMDENGVYTDAYTKSEVDTKLATKVNNSAYPFTYDSEGNLCYVWNES